MNDRKKKQPKPCQHKRFRKVGTVTKRGVTYTIEVCRNPKCHETRIR